MAIEHSNIPEDGLHEPKGVSVASSKRVYVSDGAGSGNWDKVDADTIQGDLTLSTPEGRRVITDGVGGFTSELTPASAYGTINLTNNSTVKAIVAATDTSLNTSSDYVKLDISLDTSNLLNMGSESNSLIVNEGGLYLVDFWGSVKSDINQTKFGLAFVVNDAEAVPRELKHTLSSQGVIYNLSGCGIHSFDASDSVSLFIAADKNCNITIEDMTFRMVYLGGLS